MTAVLLTLLFLGLKYRGNLLPFHSNFQGNIAFITKNDGITMEWWKITAVKSFITLAPDGREISHKLSSRWKHLSWLEASAFFSLQIIGF
jgi:hypothetical protein